MEEVKKCEYLGCNNLATTVTKGSANDGSEIEYHVCSDHQNQMDNITLSYGDEISSN